MSLEKTNQDLILRGMRLHYDLLHSDRWIARSIVLSDVDGRKRHLHFL